jgi:adenylate cyclase
LSADVVGFSRLMGEDEQATLESLKQSRAAITKLVNEQKGHILDTAGDSVLAEFPSVVRAVECAIAIQKELDTLNHNRPQGRHMRYRIGVSLGDVIADEQTIYGDGVNLAARTQTLSDPGGICLSGPAYEQVRDKLDLKVESLGKQRLKNIAEPVVCYRVLFGQGQSSVSPKAFVRALLGVLAVAGIAAATIGIVLLLVDRDEPTVNPRPVPAGQPSVAVLPFTNLSDDPAQEYFSDGITEEIITSLSRLSGLLVISRSSSFAYKGQLIDVREVGKQLDARYVLEGSVQRYQDRVRIIAHFVDAESGFQLWAERYDRPFEDALALQDEITRQIVDSLSIELSAAERRNLAKRYTNDMQAFDNFLQGQAQFVRHTPEANRRARELFTRAIERDPAFARAYGAKALTYADAYRFFWTDSPEPDAEEALNLARQAVALDIDSPETNWVLGYVELFVAGDSERAIESGERALAGDPNNSDAHALLAVCYVFSGRPERGRELIEQAMQLNPHHPSQYPSVLGYAHFFSGEYDSARLALEEAIRQNPDRVSPNIFLVATLVRMGQLGDAKWQAEIVRSIDPQFDIQAWAQRWPYWEAEIRDRFVADLQRAGL